jgi:ribosomal protein S4
MKPTATTKASTSASPAKEAKRGNPLRKHVLCKRRRHLGLNVTHSQRIPVNATRSPRKWESRGDTIHMEGISNEALLGKTRDLTGSDASMPQTKRRIKAFYKMEQVRSAKLKTMYHRVSTPTRKKTIRRDMIKSTGSMSMVATLEQRVDVLLFRAGLTRSLAQAHARCVQGHVRRKRADESTYRVWKHPSAILPVGGSLQRDETMWVSRSARIQGLRSQGETQGPDHDRRVPPYREVDYERGALVRLHRPQDGEVIYPANSGMTLKSVRR